MSKSRRKLRRPLETGAFRLAQATVPYLPRRILLALARLAGRLGFRLDRAGHAIGMANLNVAFGDSKSLAEKKAILKAAYITMMQTMLDVIWFSRHCEKRVRRYVKLDDSTKPVLCPKNQICITAHFGNWEILGLATATNGFPLHSIAMPVKNPKVDKLLIRRREISGQKIIPREGALRKLLSVLRSGGKAAFLVDQNTREEEGGIWVDYFGLPVPVTPAPASLAAKTGSHVFIGFCRPLPDGSYHVYTTADFPAPDPKDKEAIQAVTQQTLTAIEQEVRIHPENWLWMYKRWKKINRPEDAGRYPFYAR